MHRSRFTCVVILVMTLTLSLSMTSCGTGGEGDGDLVLLGFNLPNLAGIPLNNPLIFTFSANVAPGTITPDSLRVVGTTGPFFETTVVDGNLVALLPRSPNFEDYSDSGMAPDIEYTVSLTTFPAVTTIESVSGKPLLDAESFTFKTQPFPVFIEPRRPINHGTPWTQGGRSDDAGCLQNSDNELYVTPFTDPAAIQTGSGVGASLLCLQNEGPPRIIEPACIPRHNQLAFGSASPVSPGLIQIPAIRLRVNENLDPLTVAPYIPTTQLGVNVQLWRVALKDNTFVPTGPDRIKTNQPVVVQDLELTEIILVPSGPIPQGVYCINVTPSIRDLPGNSLRFDDRPDPQPGGFDVYEAEPQFGANIPPGYRIYFKTDEIPETPLSIIEDFNNNQSEWGDNDSAGLEPGLYDQSLLDAQNFVLDGNPLLTLGLGPLPEGTKTFDVATDPVGAFGGQTTTASWNSGGIALVDGPITDVDGYRFLNIPTLEPNLNPGNPKPGTLQAVYQPWCGNNQDGAFTTAGNGGATGISTDSFSANGDGILECSSFTIQAGDTVLVGGSKPLVILCSGDVNIAGTLRGDGANGGPGFNTDGTSDYSPHLGAISSGGPGGEGGPGGGAGGSGANPTWNTDSLAASGNANGSNGEQGNTMFLDLVGAGEGTAPASPPGESVAGANDGSTGGNGGGFDAGATTGGNLGGVAAGAAGGAFGDPRFMRPIALFMPDRGYQSNSNISGGGGGSGGTADDDNGASEDGNGDGTNGGDDGGGGGGGAAGGIWIIAKGTINIASTAVISVDGGDGGNTYARGNQNFSPGEDGDPGGGDDFLTGPLDPNAAGSGDGGPGGGGAGGGLYFISRDGIVVSAGATITALGGVGGTSGEANRTGGNGAPGRITYETFDGGGNIANGAGATTSPAALENNNSFFPAVDLQSTAQSNWVDLFTASTEWAPVVNGQPQFPTFNGNFAFAPDEGFLQLAPPLGGGKTIGVDFDARLEFQGADDLAPAPEEGMPPPTSADGLTAWFDVTNVTAINMKRFFRWRWRFFHKDGWGQDPGDPADLPLATIFDMELPFVK